MKGIIKKLNEKGFGFISPENGGKDVFFHANDLSGIAIEDLHEGDAVTFGMEDSDKGPKATDVVLAGSDDATTDDKAVTDDDATDDTASDDKAVTDDATDDTASDDKAVTDDTATPSTEEEKK